MKDFLYSLPWHDILDWTFRVGIPALLVLWRRSANHAATSNKMVEAMVQGIESAQSPDTAFIKRSVRDASVQKGVGEQLDAKVAELTPLPKP